MQRCSGAGTVQSDKEYTRFVVARKETRGGTTAFGGNWTYTAPRQPQAHRVADPAQSGQCYVLACEPGPEPGGRTTRPCSCFRSTGQTVRHRGYRVRHRGQRSTDRLLTLAEER